MTRPVYRDHITAAVTLATNRGSGRRVIANSYFFRLLARLTPTIEVRAPSGIRYFIDTRDVGVGLHLYMHGAFDGQVMDDILCILKEETGETIAGRTFIDIGANIGTTTLLAIKKYGAARVIAFEPEPRNLDLLRLALAANDLADVVDVHQVALSDHEDSLTMELSPVNTGDHRIRTTLAAGHMGEEDRKVVTIAAVRFDSLGIGLTDVAVVWMDIQGHEGHMLAGAPNLLATHIPVVAEYCPYMLARSGGLDLFHELVEESFDQVVDCHTRARIDAKAMASLASKYPNPTDFTDLLLLHG